VVAWRPEYAGPGELHGAESDATNGELSERKGLHDDRVGISARFRALSAGNRAEIAGYSDSPRIW
jgi:hypothetical protein